MPPAIPSSSPAISTSPTAPEGNSHFNDNKRLHIFVVDVATGQSRQLTNGDSLRAFDRLVARRQGDRLRLQSRAERRPVLQLRSVHSRCLRPAKSDALTATESAEYRPHWSPDGKTIVYEATKRGLTDLETTMEDTHVWLIDADGKNRREAGRRHRRPPGRAAAGRATAAAIYLHRAGARRGASLSRAHRPAESRSRL